MINIGKLTDLIVNAVWLTRDGLSARDVLEFFAPHLGLKLSEEVLNAFDLAVRTINSPDKTNMRFWGELNAILAKLVEEQL